MAKEIQLQPSPEAKQFYMAVTASLTTFLLIEIIRALKERSMAKKAGV